MIIELKQSLYQNNNKKKNDKIKQVTQIAKNNKVHFNNILNHYNAFKLKQVI